MKYQLILIIFCFLMISCGVRPQVLVTITFYDNKSNAVKTIDCRWCDITRTDSCVVVDKDGEIYYWKGNYIIFTTYHHEILCTH